MKFRGGGVDGEEAPETKRSARGQEGPGLGTVLVVAIVVLLIAAIAIVNRGGGSSDGGTSGDGGAPTDAQPTAPTGTKPVPTRDGKVPSDFPRSSQGVQSAAANYAVALGGKDMFVVATRHKILKRVSEPDALDKLQPQYDASYRALAKRLELDGQGNPSKGQGTFVNRTIPVGTKTKAYSRDKATVAVWCSGLFGIAGEGSTTPVSDAWFTLTLHLKWDGGWKITDSQQKDGPTPQRGDAKAAGADEIGEAAKDYGDLTYSR